MYIVLHQAEDPQNYTLKPKPCMQLLYWSTRDTQSAAGFLAVEKSIHSSRFAFSSLHTQQGCLDISTGVSSMPKVRQQREADLGLGSTLGLCGRRNRRRGQGYIFHMTISFAQKKNWKQIDVQKVAGLASMVLVGRSANGMWCVMVVSITARPVSSYF